MSKKHVATSREYSKHSKTNQIIGGLIYLVLGIIIFICGAEWIDIIFMAAGIMTIIMAVLSFAENKMTNALIVSLIIGIVLIVLGYYGLAASIVRIIFGILIILSGIGMILGNQSGFVAFDISFGNAVINYVVGGLIVLLGIFCLINYADSFGWIIRFIGLFIAVIGVARIAKATGFIS